LTVIKLDPLFRSVKGTDGVVDCACTGAARELADGVVDCACTGAARELADGVVDSVFCTGSVVAIAGCACIGFEFLDESFRLGSFDIGSYLLSASANLIALSGSTSSLVNYKFLIRRLVDISESDMALTVDPCRNGLLTHRIAIQFYCFLHYFLLFGI